MADTTRDSKQQAPGQMSTNSWRQELERLARRAEAAGSNASLQERQELATEAFRLLWLAWAPDVIARSCRLSARLYEPLLADPGPLDLQVLHSYNARLAALRSVGALVELGPGPVADPALIGVKMGRGGKPTAGPVEVQEGEAQAPPEPAAEPDGLVGGRRRVVAPPPQPRILRPASQRMAPRPPAPAAEPAPDRAPMPDGWGDQSEPVPPAAAPAPAPADPPADWLSAGEACELLGIDAEQLEHHRAKGDLGAVRIDYTEHPRGFYYNPAKVEELEAALSAPDLDALLSDLRG